MTANNTTISIIYNISKQVYEGNLKRNEGIEIAAKNGVNSSSMASCIYVFSHLREGTGYTRNLTLLHNKYDFSYRLRPPS